MGLRPRRMMRRRRRRARRRIMLAGGMVAFGVHKMSQSQAKQVEEHTGVPPEELEDEDLEAAMAELNIPNQELTDEDRAAGAGTDD
jgi:hypothetical protein